MTRKESRDARYWIDGLRMEAHPEGGYYRETYRSTGQIGSCCLEERFDGPRSYATSIYYLLTSDQVSAFHRLRSDEIWHYHAGAALTLHVLTARGEYRALVLGPDLEREQSPQVVIRAGDWFGATVNARSSYALTGCAVAPGFDFRDFEIGCRSELMRSFPLHRAIIVRLTRESKETGGAR